MRVIIFGTVIRTRRSLGRIIAKAREDGRDRHMSFRWAVHIYNSGIFGLCFYRVNARLRNADWICEKYKTKNDV